MQTAPQGGGTVRRRRSSRPFAERRDWRRRLTIVVAYRGGPEAQVQVQARGRTKWYAGHECFLDVLIDIWEGDTQRDD